MIVSSGQSKTAPWIQRSNRTGALKEQPIHKDISKWNIMNVLEYSLSALRFLTQKCEGQFLRTYQLGYTYILTFLSLPVVSYLTHENCTYWKYCPFVLRCSYLCVQPEALQMLFHAQSFHLCVQSNLPCQLWSRFSHLGEACFLEEILECFIFRAMTPLQSVLPSGTLLSQHFCLSGSKIFVFLLQPCCFTNGSFDD